MEPEMTLEQKAKLVEAEHIMVTYRNQPTRFWLIATHSQQARLFNPETGKTVKMPWTDLQGRLVK